ncbi:hypothetical protein U1872_05680 [Sphingomonas sp. RB3P16]|uniref:hypothetical protein n=1 Tax=Parasphingomonas frigoris TaxID=3096163 RepID=UPI002FC79D08
MPVPPADPTEEFVTASDLVRHFGLWQDHAARAPLYILHRGRPRFVLASIAIMEALCAPHGATGADPVRPPIDATVLLDVIADLVLVADAGGAIIASSRTARAHFGSIARIGAPIAGIAPPALRDGLRDVIRRVSAWGVGDRFETPSAARAARRLLLVIEPAASGVVIVAGDA